MKRLFLLLLALICYSVNTYAYPEPTKAPKPDIWTLQTEVQQPQQITVNIPGKGNQRFWYIILSVTNKTDREVPFYPKCELMTDTFKITLAGKKTPGFVFDKLKVRYQGKFPFLENFEAVDRRVLIGADNTVDMAIIYPDFDDKAKNIKMFIAGLSNELAKVSDPLDEQGSEPIYLRKTLQLEYNIGGDPAKRDYAKLEFVGKEWVMR